LEDERGGYQKLHIKELHDFYTDIVNLTALPYSFRGDREKPGNDNRDYIYIYIYISI
jgi:hypothetical protein